MRPLSRNSSRFVTSPLLAIFCFASLLAYPSASAAQEAKSTQEIPLYFPPPLAVEPLPPRTPPEDELERDPGGILVLPNTPANDVSGSCSDNPETNACAQNETALAINPTNNDNWVGGANDYSGPIMLDGRAQASCGFYSSNDSGQTWSGGLLPTQDGFTGGGDPSLAFDSDGNVYYACLNFELTLPGYNLGQSGLYVFKSTNGGQTFSAPTEVITGTGSTDFHDKQFITTGALTNKIYLGWMHQGDIRLTGSDDAGASFSSPAPAANVEINDPTNSSNQGVVLATLGFPNPEGPDGEALYAAWVDLDQNRILFDTSTDGGMTFGNDVVVEGSLVQFPMRPTGSGIGVDDRTTLIGEHGDLVENPENAFRVNSFPSMDVCRNQLSPFFGHIYMVYADYRFGNGDVFFKRSEDGGVTWPGGFTRKVNDDDGDHDQFFPWIDVDENCKVNIAFYDRRDDQDNLRFHLYFTHSTDSGSTFSTNARVTTVASSNWQFHGGFVGDYLQTAATTAESASFHHQVDRAGVLWMDTRNAGQDAYAGSVLQTNNGTWINIDVDLVANQLATDLDFVFPGDVSGDFGGIYHGDANPFQDEEITYDAGENETKLVFLDPQPGPLQPGDMAHVGFILEADVPIIDTFWTGSGDIGSIPMTSLDFTYDPEDRIVTAFLCNDRADGKAIAIAMPSYAVVKLPIELKDLNGDALPAELAEQGESLAALSAAAGALPSGECYEAQIPGEVAQFEAVVINATLSFTGSAGRSRSNLFAQKVAKDAREVDEPSRKRFVYLAKLLCGTQPSTTDLRLARGHYATTINVHNLDKRPAKLTKSLSLAIPPGGQEPGEIYPLGRDMLPAGRSLATECNEIRKKVFDGNLPAPVIDGFVKIVSDRRLVVSGVYTTATLNAEGTAEDHSSIHIEAAVERKLENSDEDPLRADLVVDDDFSIDANCEDRRCRISLRFTVRNVGAGVAGPFTVDIARNQPMASLANVSVPTGLAPAAAFADSVTVDYQLNQNDPKKLCVKADHPTNAVNESNETNNERCFGF